MKTHNHVIPVPQPFPPDRRRRTFLAAAMLSALWVPFAPGFDHTPYPDGNPPDGSAAHPWKMDLPEDFDAIGTDVAHALNHHYFLTRDLDFAFGEHRVRAAFSGTFDGGYHRISRLWVEQPLENEVGLFKGVTSGGVVRRLAVLHSRFRGYRTVGPITAAMHSGSRIEECWTRGNVVTAVSYQSAGGIIGGAAYPTPSAVLANSFSRDNQVSCPGHQTAGGISGYQDARIEFCYSAGNTVTAPNLVGGIVGYGTPSGSIISSYSDATNSPSVQVGYFTGGWSNPLVSDRLSGGFDIKAHSITQLGWSPTIWRRGADGYPWLTGFNEEPVADAGASQTIQLGTRAQLVGCATTDDRTPLTGLVFAWTILNNRPGELDAPDTSTPTFRPDMAGVYRIGLTVVDGDGFSDFAVTHVIVVDPAPNGSFENDFGGWDATGNVAVKAGLPYQPTQGEKLAVFNSQDTSPNGGLSRQIATIPGQAYRLEFDAGVLAYNRDKQKLRMTVTGLAEVLADEINLTGLGSGKNLWVGKSYVFTADSTAMTLHFRDLSTATNSLDLLLDNVRITPLTTTLTVCTQPATGVMVGVSPSDTAASGDGATTLRRFYNPGATVSLTAPVDADGRTFSHWLLDGVPQGVKPAMQVVMDGDHLASAIYQGGDPMITLQPVSAEAVIGGRVVFRVSATGTSPLGYQWRHDGEEITGADSAELVIDPVVQDSTGTYDVVVFNASGSVLSDPAELVIQSGFAGLENGGFESEFQGWTVSGNVWVRTGSPYRPTEGVRLAAFNAGNTPPGGTLSRMVETTPGQTYFLTFDAGVLAYNTQRQTIEVEVTGSPSLLRQSFVVTGSGGGKTVWRTCDLAFTADSTRSTIAFRDLSSYTNSIDLLLDNVVLVPRVERVLRVETTDPVSVAVAPPDLDGLAQGSDTFTRRYADGTVVTLEASEGFGGIYPDKTRSWGFLRWMLDGTEFSTSPLVTVTMDCDKRMRAEYKLNPPVINSQPMNQYASVGASVTFQVGASGGVDGYQWHHNGIPIPGAESSSLTVSPVTPGSAGGYVVFVSNTGGTVRSQAATLTVVENGPVNASFEGGLDEWTTGGNVRALQLPPGTAPDGDWLAAFNSANTAPNGWVAQVFATTPGTAYRLTFEMGVLAYNTQSQKMMVDIDGSGAIARETFTMRGLGGGKTVWLLQTIEFTADSAAALVTFQDVSTATNGIDLLLDDIRIEQLTPEGFTYIPEGWFTMGCTSGDTDANSPPVNVYVSGFFMGRFEVTKQQWDEVRAWGVGNGYTDLPAGGGKGPDHPVHSVNWYDAVKWCNARSEMENLQPCFTVAGNVVRTGEENLVVCDWAGNGYRLASEAEWEKAARGGVAGLRFPWGDTISHDQANYYGNPSSYSYDLGPHGYHPLGYSGIQPYTTPVGSFDANGFGLHDVIGNVREWCWDPPVPYLDGAINPRGATTGSSRAQRGGTWFSHPDECRSSFRSVLSGPSLRYFAMGFRLARSAAP